ncbi:MAG: hypothetical protein L0332_04065 [Chloroflexi bacterium]|nr:hypothetical protein [Chloroflexota bacterium]MCI0643738.1 hypothetical protein [Chloroflexota bacterium]MCI0725885.1 hypothetical protein [Chloroflexota bacterium]
MKSVVCIIDFVPDAKAGCYWVRIGKDFETNPIFIAEQFGTLEEALGWIRQTYPQELAKWRESQEDKLTG